jgi:hypothetical protein
MADFTLLKKIADLVTGLIKGQINSKDGLAATMSFPLMEAPVRNPAQNASEPVELPESHEIDWTNPSSRINKRFTVKEALFLPSWGVMHVPSEDEKKAIVEIANLVEKAADIIAQKTGTKGLVSVHAWMRPEKANCPGSKWDGHDYNRYIYETQVWKDLTPEEKAKKHVPNSPHKTGHAIDFHISGFEGAANCAKIRQILLPHLEELGLRMEDLNGGWVHLDNLPVIHLRFFKP